MSSSPFTDLNHVKKSSGTQDVDDGPQWQERVSVVGTAFCHEALLGMKQEILGGMGCDAGIHFNEKWKHGTKFSSLGDCFEGSFYMMCLQQSLGQAVHTCLTNLQILHSRLHGDSPKLLSSNFPKVKPSAFQEVLDPALSILEGLRKAPNPQKPLSLQTEEGDIASRGRNPLSPATLELLDTHIPSMRLPKLYPTTYTPLRSLPPDPEAALGTLGTPILPQRLSSPTRILPRTTTTAGYVEIMEARVDAALSAERAAALKVARARAAAERAAKEAAEAAEHAQWREERTRRATIERGMSLQERVERALEWRRGASVHARGGLAGHANEGNGEQDGNGGGKREKVKRSVREFLGKYSRDSVGRLRILAAGTTRKESSAGGRAKQLLDWGDQEEFEDDEFL
ncbi:hypothetical protein DFJ73DRAFT_759318 [Zopfochytrium polystomum]|nr:hypothetical protein DFJ73DRAFT_759318 [Zopfochytrium polystomum]